MPASRYQPTDIHELSTFFADARTQPVRNIMSLIPVTERPAIAAATSTYPIAPALAVAAATPGIWEFPAGDYILNTASQILLTTPGVEWRGQSGARLLLQDGGVSNPIIVQDTTDVVIQGLTLIDDRVVDPKTGSGITIINSSRVAVLNNTIIGFTLYGIGVHDNNNTAYVSAATISYSGNTISDSANGLGIFAAGMDVGVSGTLYNNHIFHVTSVDPGGASMVVAENLIAESAGASRTYAASNTIGFTAATKRMYAATPLFLNFKEGDSAVVSGATNAGNNQAITIDSADPDGDGFSVLEALVQEAPGATVTVTKVGLSRIQVMDRKVCDDITIEGNTVSNIRRIGIEIFPKLASRNLVVRGNRVYECGKGITGGCGIKASQGTINATVTDNTVMHCQIGMIVTCWDTSTVSNNTILNCAKHGIAIGISHHIRYETAPFNALKLHNNLVAYCEDVSTGILYTSPFQYPAININGLELSNGLLDIAYNDIYKWPVGIYSQYVLRSHPNVRFRYNVLVDSGSSLLIPVTATANTTNGSPTLTNITIGGVLTTGGFAIGSEIHGPGIPTNTFVRDIDGVTKEITLGTADGVSTVNATATASTVPIYSAYLDRVQIIGNTWVNTDDTKNLTVQIYSTNGRLLNNILDGMGAYSMTVGGDGTVIMGNRWFRPNPVLTANRGVILLAVAGTYHIHDNYADVSTAPTALAYMVNNTDATTVHITNTYASEESIRPLFSPTPVAATGLFGQYGKNRITYGAAAPSDLTKNRYTGDIHYNTAPSAISAIWGWLNMVTGSAGQVWQAMGRGRGTTAQRPTPNLLDVNYEFWDTSKRKSYLWSGTAWDLLTGIKTLFQANAATTIANTTTETSLLPSGIGSLSLSSVFFQAGSGVRLRLEGTFADTGTPTLRLRLKMGSTTIVDTTALALPALGGTRAWSADCQLVCRTAGGTGTIEGSIVFRFASADVGAEYVFNVPQAATTFDTTAATTIAMTAQWGTADPANTLTTNLLRVEDIT